MKHEINKEHYLFDITYDGHNRCPVCKNSSLVYNMDGGINETQFKVLGRLKEWPEVLVAECQHCKAHGIIAI